ncbi:MAG: methyltransferase domain-containing protein [Ideonella sp.]
MQDYYAARASEYDRIYLKTERQSDLRKIEQWLPDQLAGRSVLEIACGTGYWTQFFAPRAKRVVALDSAQETLDIAQSRVPSDTVRFRIGDAYDIAAETPRFDAAFAGFWWSHIPLERIPEFLNGLHAALEPGATVIFLENRYVAGSSTPLSGRDSEGNTYQTRRLDDGSEHRILKNFPSRDELFSAVAQVGNSPRFHEWEYYWALEYASAAR